MISPRLAASRRSAACFFFFLAFEEGMLRCQWWSKIVLNFYIYMFFFYTKHKQKIANISFTVNATSYFDWNGFWYQKSCLTHLQLGARPRTPHTTIPFICQLKYDCTACAPSTVICHILYLYSFPQCLQQKYGTTSWRTTLKRMIQYGKNTLIRPMHLMNAWWTNGIRLLTFSSFLSVISRYLHDKLAAYHRIEHRLRFSSPS